MTDLQLLHNMLELLESDSPGKVHMARALLRQTIDAHTLASNPAGLRKKQQPIDEEWIANCWRKSLIGTRISYVEYRDFVREVERAHNIKEK